MEEIARRDASQELRQTLRTAKLSENLVNVALACWRCCERAPDRVGRVVVGDLADDLGKDARSIRRWINQVTDLGIVQMRSHNRQAGVYRVIMVRAAGEGSIDLAQPPNTDDTQQSIEFGDELEPAVLAFPSADRASAQPAKPGRSADQRSADHSSADGASAQNQPRDQRPTWPPKKPEGAELQAALAMTAECRAIIERARGEQTAIGTAAATHAGPREDLRPKRPNAIKDLDLRPKDSSKEPPTDSTPGAPSDPLAMGETFAVAAGSSQAKSELANRRATAAAIARELAAGDALEPAFWMNLADTLGLGRFTEREVRRALRYAIKHGGDEPARRAKIFSTSVKRRAHECQAEWPRAP